MMEHHSLSCLLVWIDSDVHGAFVLNSRRDHTTWLMCTWSWLYYFPECSWIYVCCLCFFYICLKVLVLIQVWAGPLSGNRLVVALWNRCSQAVTITVTWETLGLDNTTCFSVRDLWKVRVTLFTKGNLQDLVCLCTCINDPVSMFKGYHRVK